ncbi:MAG: hypothetical protein QOI47_411, partial [Actinomycetota bacterium]|nr:hypothetical protein [Actinomycetota bacterium]
AAVGCLSAGVRGTPIWRLGWHLLGTAAVLWCAANISSACADVGLAPRALVDVLFVGAQLVALGAIAVLARPIVVDRAARLRALFDGTIVALSLSSILFSAVLDRIAAGHGLVNKVLIAVYPLTDILLVSLAVVALARAPRIAWRVALMLACSVAVLSMGDGLGAIATVTRHPLGDVPRTLLYAAGYLCLAFAPILRRANVASESQAGPVGARLAMHAPLVVALLLIMYRQGYQSAVGLMTAVLTVLLLLRLLLSMADHLTLARSLESRVLERTAELAASEARFRAVADQISDAFIVLDRDLEIAYISSGFDRISGIAMTGFSTDELIASLHPDDKDAAIAAIERASAEPGLSLAFRCRAIRADGTWGDAEVRVSNHFDDPLVAGLIIGVSDMTEARELERQLRHQAYHDELTGLANRPAMRERLDADFERGAAPAVVRLGLDDFKSVNDSLGPRIGDELLVVVAARLRDCVGPRDLLARISGDEFAVIVEDPDAAFDVAEAILASLDTLHHVGDREIRCQASIGVASVGADATALLRNADLAMHEAKSRGKGRVEAFRRSMLRRVERRTALEVGLAAAVERDELHLLYQPVVDIVTGEVLGAEALMRWQHDGELIDPSEFIAVAEETGLIGAIGRWALERACAEAERWHQARPDGYPPHVAVNISAMQLAEHDLVADVAAALAHSGLAPECLTIELTESTLMDHSDAVLERLHALKRLGVRLSIDDFGTGYSSLGRLRFVPVDEVKIDQSFVSYVSSCDDAMPVVEAVVALAASMHLEVVAEGVEQQVQVAALRQRGCRRAQGYLFGRPMSGKAFEAVLMSGLDVDNLTLKFKV